MYSWLLFRPFVSFVVGLWFDLGFSPLIKFPVDKKKKSLVAGPLGDNCVGEVILVFFLSLNSRGPICCIVCMSFLCVGSVHL